MPVVLQIDAKQLKKLTKTMSGIEQGVPKVLAPAINRALASGQTTVRREIRKVYTIKQKDIPTKVLRATRATLAGAVRIEQGMLDASKFEYRPRGVQKRKNKKPLFIRVKKGRGGLVKNSFVAEMPTGYAGPFQRSATVPRLPVRKIIVIGAPIMASQPSVGPAVNKAMGDTLAKRIDHEIKRVMEKNV